jgi:hypothetical protein
VNRGLAVADESGVQKSVSVLDIGELGNAWSHSLCLGKLPNSTFHD